MECMRCRKASELKTGSENLCRNCFLKIIEKRIRKEVRQGNLLKKSESIILADDGSLEAKVTIGMFWQIFKNIRTRVETRKLSFVPGKSIKGNFSKVIIPWSADMEDEYFLGCILNDEPMKYLGHYRQRGKQYVKLLLPLSKEEIAGFAKIAGITGKERKKGPVSDMLEKLSAGYPEIKLALLKSAREIGKKR